ncbi:MAG: hypothetical protein BA863_01615 [Desulfovibrio sp. S3730MH75]|nr:MAG: hypothetical protein BA863_01615 [Desulfovibrio sp. S3730MH75]
MKIVRLSLLLFVVAFSLLGCGSSANTDLAQPYSILNANYDDFSTGGIKRKLMLITVNNPSLTADERGHTALAACFNEQTKSGYDLVKVWLVCDPKIIPFLAETVLAEAIADTSKDKPVWQVRATDDTPTPNEIKLMRAAGQDRFAAWRKSMPANDFYAKVSQAIGIPPTLTRYLKYKTVEIN